MSAVGIARDWWADYIGIPFVEHGRDRSGCDCWGLVRLIYAEQLGIELPSWNAYRHVMDGGAIYAQLDKVLPLWEPLTIPHAFAVGLFAVGHSRVHVGLFADVDRMIHIEKGKDACLQKTTYYLPHLKGIYRWPTLTPSAS